MVFLQIGPSFPSKFYIFRKPCISYKIMNIYFHFSDILTFEDNSQIPRNLPYLVEYLYYFVLLLFQIPGNLSTSLPSGKIHNRGGTEGELICSFQLICPFQEISLLISFHIVWDQQQICHLINWSKLY